MQQDQADDYLIASGETHSVRELVECAFGCVGLEWEQYVSVDPTFYRPDESVKLVGQIDKIRRRLNWEPQYSFEHLVELMVDHDLKELGDRTV